MLPLPGQRDARTQKCFRLTLEKGAGFNMAAGQVGPRHVDTGNSTQMIANYKNGPRQQREGLGAVRTARSLHQPKPSPRLPGGAPRLHNWLLPGACAVYSGCAEDAQTRRDLGPRTPVEGNLHSDEPTCGVTFCLLKGRSLLGAHLRPDPHSRHPPFGPLTVTSPRNQKALAATDPARPYFPDGPAPPLCLASPASMA
ncbi:hypothetical protein HJG60_010387 [Phyllostomus discolor]|uniref:Uncharacterized protein n=1 Tax=Phyllostomus discolor TaxID=89673 RepID=A0A834B1U0_9CHIR|nr:hypothetical protein HJG60_010387 [Phyllostomus discolor]